MLNGYDDMTPQYRADQVGSLLRPPDLLEARARFGEGRLPAADLRAIEDRAVEAVLRMQREIGIDILTDGEMRRGSWITDMAEAVDGFIPQSVPLEWKGPGGGVEASTAHVAGAVLRKTRKLTAHEMPFLKRTARGPFKITLPAPSNFVLASYRPGVTDKSYASRAAFLDAVVEIVRDEIRWLVDEGVTYIQFDAPFYSHYLDPRHREQMHREGVDPDKELEFGIAGDNAALAEIESDAVTRALHVCRGNSRSRWYTEGGYDAIAEKLLGTVNVDRFLLEYDDARSGGFEVLRFVPRGKTVVLGLVTTKTPALESQDELCRRIDQAAQYVPLEHLAVSPQCGFASTAAGNQLSHDEQWRKLELVVQMARSVWS
jgi:5-methyltetrahydropteroyltriglutamate--homocysteine methyltransferase